MNPLRQPLKAALTALHLYLWQAVDQDRNSLDILVQRRRDKTAAKKFFRRLRKGLMYIPRVPVGLLPPQ